MLSADADCVVIGAGVIGLAVARALALAGRDVVVVEAAGAIGTETSSRNSEVIHAGIYYPEGSLKALTCVAGKHALYDYCAAHGVPHRHCGKLIVATSDAQLDQLDAIKARAAANGVPDLAFMSAADVEAIEPVVHCTGALVSPSTGIIDSHALMLAYQGDLEDAGGAIAFHCPVVRGAAGDGAITVEVGGAAPMRLAARVVVNAAGLSATKVAALIEGLPADAVPTYYFAKGNYYALAGRSPFSRLIYPVPATAGLGVHVSLDLAGQARFGPDVEWIEAVDYDVDPARADAFYAAVRRYWPGLPDGALAPDYAGVRPKLQAPGEPPADFMIDGPAAHGIAGLVNLYGIESPGLTASLAIARRVLDALDIAVK